MIKIPPSTIHRDNNIKYLEQTSQHDNKIKKDYTDPLNKWPARGFAYSNELGAAISEVAPKVGLLLWVPALLYFGADIYDKYKNDKTSFDPSTTRGTEQAIFQLLASVILPTASVIAGQKVASVAGSMGNKGLTLQTQEEITKFSLGFMSRRELNEYGNDIPKYKQEFYKSLDNQMSEQLRETQFKNPLKLLATAVFNRRHPESMALSKKEKVHKYAEEQINKMFEIRNHLINNEKPAEFSTKLFNKFQKNKLKLKQDPEYAINFVEYATKDAIKSFENSRILKAKILKTIGGFVALGLAIKPIDNFVEQIIIKKYVEPTLHKSVKPRADNSDSIKSHP